MAKEEYAFILDYLSQGYADSYRKEPVAQALGERHFSLLELVPRPDISLTIRERVYIGDEKRDKIKFIKDRLPYTRLTATARSELKDIVEEVVKKNESHFINVFNKAGPITVRQHSLELFPNIGKKHMWDIINEREKEPFKNFADIQKRINLMPDPVRVISERILEELEGRSKYNIIVRR